MTATIFAHPATGHTASHFKQPAVYRHGFAISPRVFARVLPGTSRLLKIRGRRECRARDAPAASCVKNKHTSVVTTVTPERPGIPRAMVYGLLRALPGDHACLTPSPARLLADLTPALGRQNHTTWPYASALFVNCAAASTASRPASVTIAKRPSIGTGR